MADSKRNSIAGKVATPKTAPAANPAPVQPTMDQMEALGKAIGARLRVTTVAPQTETYEGTLFTACPILNIVAVNTRTTAGITAADAAAQAGDYRVIPVSRIHSFQILSLAESGTNGGMNGVAPTTASTTYPPIGPLDIKRLKEREQGYIEKLKEEELNRGKGVTKEAQAIFDSLKRINMPVRWHNQEMIVHEAVIIRPPYRVEDCKCPKDKQETLNRVRKVLEGERRKLKEKEERERKAPTPTGPRKGG